MSARYAFRTTAPLGLEGPEAALLWEHGCRGVREDGDEVVGYFDEPVEDLPLDGGWEVLPDEDYLRSYREGLAPIELGALTVSPTHCRPCLEPGRKVLWLDPGTAFGTGHHETTRLALEALEELELRELRVLDVGSGSGILAIAADLLGAAEAWGIDNDPQTIPVARANADLNRSRARFAERELEGAGLADVVVANLYAELHVQLASAYAEALPPGGRLLVTGILADRSELVERALAPYFTDLQWRSAGEWRLASAVRGGEG